MRSMVTNTIGEIENDHSKSCSCNVPKIAKLGLVC